MRNHFGILSCGILLLNICGLPNSSDASGQKLKREHPLFGKCTASDLGGGAASSGTSFLQGDSPPSDEECMQILADEKVLIYEALNAADKSTEEAGPLVTESSPPEEVVAVAAELLRDDPAADAAHDKATLKRMWTLLSNAAGESTLFVLGLGPELFAFSKLAKNVIAVETDEVFCQHFLRSKAGACGMQRNVHIYCVRPRAREQSPTSGDSQLEEAASVSDATLETTNKDVSSGDLAQNGGPTKFLKACKLLLEDLVAQQFGDVPLSALVVLGNYPVAKLLLMRPFVDQSTVIFSRSRMSSRGLLALSGLMRVLASYDAGHQSDSDSTESVFLLQRIFSPTTKGDLWMDYTSSGWELSDDKAPLQLVAGARQAVRSIASADVSQAKREALDAYLDVYALVSRRGTDEQWKAIKQSVEALRVKAAKGDTFDNVLNTAREFALQAAQGAAAIAGLHDYVKLLMDTLAKQDKQQEPVIHAIICNLVANTLNLLGSPNVLEKLKDGIEEACELAESKPQLFLPALRLLHGGLTGEDCIGKAVRILVRLKKLEPEVDVSVLTRQTEL